LASGLSEDLLRDPSHYQRKSNQKEEARSCTVIFPVSHSLSSGCQIGGLGPAVHQAKWE
jgi:hypothetical protein